MIGELIPAQEEKLAKAADSTALFEIENLSCESDGAPALDRISLAIRAGEIAGIAGVDGNGQAELVEVIAGVNLPMLVKLASVRATHALADAVAEAQEAGRKYINVASRLLADQAG